MSSTKTRIVKVCPHCGKSYAFNEVHTCHKTPAAGNAVVRPKEVVDPLIGATLGDRYEITERLSQGGMGVVYKARHKVLGRVVAVKIMLKQQDEATQERFLQEAKIASTLTHPNIVYISDFGVLDDGRSYIVMEYLQGVTLSTVLRRGPLSPLRSCRIAAQIADGLQAVHDKGIIHRDLKPDNIFLLSRVSQGGREDFVKIVDFGISLTAHQSTISSSQVSGPIITGEASSMSQEAAELALQRRYTVPGMVMGTPAYMSPEQAQGEVLDGRSDQYALGCVLYEMLCGVVPFTHRRNVAKVLMGHISGRIVPLAERIPQANIPPSLDRLVQQLLAKRPPERFANMTAVSDALAQELKSLNPAAAKDLPSQAVAVVRKAGRLRRGRQRLLVFLLLGLVLFSGGMYLGYRALMPPPDRAQMARELLELRERALGVLKAQLQLPDPELRLRAITTLGQTHEASGRPLLEPLLLDHDVLVQSRAAEALGQLGDRRSLPPLRALAERATTPPVVRVAVAGALDLLGDSQGQKLLHTELTSHDPEARLRAALVLCSASEVEAQSVLRDWLGRGNPPDQVLINTLYRLASAGDVAARNMLLSRLERGGRPEVRLSAAASLAKLGEDRGRAVLSEAAHRQDQEQVLAARLLASLEGGADVELFRRILANPTATLAALVAAAEGLADAGQSEDALALAGFLTHPEARLRQTAASAIIELTGRDPATLSDQSLAWAEGALTDGNLMIRSSAVAMLGDAAGPAVPLLKRVLTTDSEPTLRRAAARALSRRHENDALSALRLGLSDSDSDVRRETMRGIGKMGQRLRQLGDAKMLKEVKSWLLPLLSSANREEQLLASGTLYQLGDDSQRARLTAWLSSPDAAMRRAALEQLARDPELLAKVLDDKTQSPTVRLIAARKLAELKDRRGIVVLKEAVARGGLDGLWAYALLRSLGEPVTLNKDSNQLRFSRDVKMRRAALDALVGLPLAEAQSVLLAAARDTAPEIRLRSAELAAELPLGPDKLPGGLSLVRMLIYDNDQVVRMRARGLLARLLRPIVERDSAVKAPPKPTGLTTPNFAGPTALRSPPTGVSAAGAGAAADGGVPSDAGVPCVDGGPCDGGVVGDAGVPADGGSSDGGVRPPDLAEAAALQDPARLPEVIIVQYLDTSIGALKDKDYKKAQKLLERASSLCAKKGKRWKQCEKLAPEIAYQLASDYEAQGQWADAAAEYQKVKSKHPRQREAQAAIERLALRLGRIEIYKLVGSRCVHATLYMEPGIHRVSLGSGQSPMVQVKAGQTAEVKLCSPR